MLKYLLGRLKMTLYISKTWYVCIVPAMYLCIIFGVINIMNFTWREMLGMWITYTCIQLFSAIVVRNYLHSMKIGMDAAMVYIIWQRLNVNALYSILFLVVCFVVDMF